MGFKLLVVDPPTETGAGHFNEEWTQKLRQAVPDIEVILCRSVAEATGVIEEADAAYGNIVPELLERAKKLRWIACPRAGPLAGYYHQALIDSDVVVTNTREIYNDHISTHIMSFVLAFARGLHLYIPRQLKREWLGGYDVINLPDSTAVIVGVGGIGGETARLCSEFGMTVIGVDPRVPAAPPGVDELQRSDALHEVLPRGDFVIVTVPETPETRGMFAAREFGLMKSTAVFINIGRGATVVLDDLVDALRNGEIAGAGLDVFQVEPLPPDHPLWSMPGVIITPHVSGLGPHVDDRRIELLTDNCRRFNEGRPLRNVVDKARWF